MAPLQMVRKSVRVDRPRRDFKGVEMEKAAALGRRPRGDGADTGRRAGDN